MRSAELSHPNPLQSKRFVVLLKDAIGWRRLFSVQYERVNGKLGYYVHLPYFSHAQGLLRRVQLSAPPGGSEQIDMAVDSVTTTRRLKYAHHPDGEAHFSQDGQARTEVRAKTKPLSEHDPHLFTVHFWSTAEFEMAAPKDFNKPSRSRKTVTFPFSKDLGPEQIAARIVGYRYPVSSVKFDHAFPMDGNMALPILYQTPQGSIRNGIPVFPSDVSDDDFFIMLTYATIEADKSHAESSLVFVGGFHHAEQTDSGEPEDSALFIQYADRADDWDTLVSALGSVDLEAFKG